MVFIFASCNKNNTPSENESSTNTSTTTTTTNSSDNSDETHKPNDDSGTTNSKVPDSALVGEWVCTETASPKLFYGEYYNANITKTDIELKTTYIFNANGTFSTSISIENISEVRKEYRSLIVEGARKNIEAQGKFLTTADVLKYEKIADATLDEICTVQKGNYKVDGGMITYKIDGKISYETFTLSGKTLTITGSSGQSVGYPITLTKV